MIKSLEVIEEKVEVEVLKIEVEVEVEIKEKKIENINKLNYNN